MSSGDTLDLAARTPQRGNTVDNITPKITMTKSEDIQQQPITSTNNTHNVTTPKNDNKISNFGKIHSKQKPVKSAKAK